MGRFGIAAVCATLGLLAAAFTVMAQQAELPGSTPTKETIIRTVEDGGTGAYKAILTSDNTLATLTIYRSKDLSAFGETKKLPVLV